MGAQPEWGATTPGCAESYPLRLRPHPQVVLRLGYTTYQNPAIRIDPALHLPLAPWWKRLLAIIIDGLILGVPVFIFLLIIGASANNTTTTTTNNQSVSSAPLVGFFVLILLASIPGLIYYGLMNGSKRGQTVGKMAMGIAVRDARTGGPIGVGRGFGRFAIMQVFYFLLFIPYLIDNLSPLWDVRRQAWHDKVVHSVVVETRA